MTPAIVTTSWKLLGSPEQPGVIWWDGYRIDIRPEHIGAYGDNDILDCDVVIDRKTGIPTLLLPRKRGTW